MSERGKIRLDLLLTQRRDRVGKGGIVRDEAVRADLLATIRNFLGTQPGWSVVGEMVSPISRQSGNIEYLIGTHYAP